MALRPVCRCRHADGAGCGTVLCELRGGGEIPNAWLSFNPETGETFSLSVHQSCRKAGKYLLASDGGFPPGWNLLTLRGTQINTDERFEYWSVAARDGVLYFSTQSDDRHGMMEHTSTLWRMDLQTGETTNLGTIEAERVTYICDTFALDRKSVV